MKIAIYKKQDDTSLGFKVLRASLGGTKEQGYYVTYRGDLPEIIELLETCLPALKAMPQEPPTSPDDGKKYA
jgi:hypothetical protein